MIFLAICIFILAMAIWRAFGFILELRERIQQLEKEMLEAGRTMVRWDTRQCDQIDVLRRRCDRYQQRIARLENAVVGD